MNEEQFVSIDLDDDNICSVCKLGTEKETLSFCHVCFELNIEGELGSRGHPGPGAEGAANSSESFPRVAGLETPSVKSFKPLCFLSRFL